MSYEKNNIAYLITTDRTIVCSADGKRGTLKKSDKNYNKALDAVKLGDLKTLAKIVIPDLDLIEYSKQDIRIEKGKLLYRGKPVDSDLSEIILNLKEDGLPYGHLINFYERLMRNPEPSSRDQLFTFIKANGIHITEEGMIMGYKAVKTDFRDHHSGTVDYTLHTIVSMPRNKVTCSPKEACGPGLHFGSYNYASTMYTTNSIILEVLVDPANVVSVPLDSGQQKCRVCELFVSAICNGKTQGPKYEVPKEAKPKLDKVNKTKVVEPKQSKKKEAIPVAETKDGSKLPKKATNPVSYKKTSAVDTFKNADLIKIGNNKYSRKSIDTKTLNNLTKPTTTNCFIALTSSSFPKFFTDLRVEVLYRSKRPNGKFHYIAGVNGIYILYECN